MTPKSEQTDEDKHAMARSRLLEEGILPGYTTFPGANTQYKVGGFVRMDSIHDFKKTTGAPTTAISDENYFLTNLIWHVTPLLPPILLRVRHIAIRARR